jgi:hypothetical protein
MLHKASLTVYNQQLFLNFIHLLMSHIKFKAHCFMDRIGPSLGKKTIKQTPTDLGLTAKDIFNLYAPESSSCLSG